MVLEVNVNYFAVIAAAVASMAVGMIWYGPLFGKAWMKIQGITKKSMKGMKLKPAQAMTGGFIVSLVTAYVLAHFVGSVQATTIGAASRLAFWLWLGFAMPITIGSYLWENKPFKLFLINGAHWLVSLIVMASVLAIWA